MLWFMGVWVLVVYAPICHWVWGGGWLGDYGILDFAGGTVVHINAGMAGLVAALVLGKRQGYPDTAMPPNNLGYTLMGAAMLWVGWFGFNAGSELAADGCCRNGDGGHTNCNRSRRAGLDVQRMGSPRQNRVCWALHLVPWRAWSVSHRLVGFVGPMGALVIGISAGVLCFLASTKIKRAFGYDDSLDVFGVHAVGGIVGAILVGVFAAESLGGAGLAEGVSIGQQVKTQLNGILATIAYTGIVSLFILKVLDRIIGLRVTDDDEAQGLDITAHSERGYNLSS